MAGDATTEQLERSADSISDSNDSDGESRHSSIDFGADDESDHSHDELFSDLMHMTTDDDTNDLFADL